MTGARGGAAANGKTYAELELDHDKEVAAVMVNQNGVDRQLHELLQGDGGAGEGAEEQVGIIKTD